ncbi:MAG TPA: ABC transporter ATP-binding protein [Candidatus Polarisedimenticolia bacterium]|nr:ABC transporter ATP-binding protein [Candidatus Polarisedimenticolia bacterium]
MIEAIGLTRDRSVGPRPPVRVLDDVSFAVGPGVLCGLIGPNGSGKTTLLRVLAGLLRPTTGCARIAGFDVATRSLQARSRIGLLTEEASVPARLDPLWHVSFHASLRGFPREEALARARALLESISLSAGMATACGRLSRGGRLKVAVARALVHEPPVILLDEPTSALDLESAAWLRTAIARRARGGAAVLWATHDPAEAERLCDAILLLREGRLLASGSPRELRRRCPLAGDIEVRLSGQAAAVLAAVQRRPELAEARAVEDCLLLPPAASGDAGALIAPVAEACGPLSILQVRRLPPTLEQACRMLLREGAA